MLMDLNQYRNEDTRLKNSIREEKRDITTDLLIIFSDF